MDINSYDLGDFGMGVCGVRREVDDNLADGELLRLIESLKYCLKAE